MHRLAGPFRLVARRLLTHPGGLHHQGMDHSVACSNAAEASARLRKRRQDREEVDAYLHAHRRTNSEVTREEGLS